MADNDNGPENDVTDPTSEENGDVHRRFVELWNERTSGDAGAIALDSAWQPIANMLEGHAGAQVEGADPALLRESSEGATVGTNDAHPAEEERDVMPDLPGHSDEAPISHPGAR
jgi:hypothetical protein